MTNQIYVLRRPVGTFRFFATGSAIHSVVCTVATQDMADTISCLF